MKSYDFKFISMTSPCKLKVYEGSYTNALKCFEEIKKNTLYLENKYNFYDKNSYLNQTINKRTKNRIKIDSQSAQILKHVREISLLTNNIFDITTGTLKKSYTETSIEKLNRSLENLYPKIGIENWDINNRFLTFKHHETILDLGGVIKEYAVDEAVKIVRKYKINSAIINFGGDLYCVGKSPDNRPFSIAVKNPLDKTKKLLSLNLEDQALTTSANYERSFKIENKNFSHILTDKKRNTEILSATIISSSALVSGIYSTAFMVNAEFEIPDDLKVVLIDNDLRIHHNYMKTISKFSID